ncbi:histidine kinase [Paenibacillus cellulosilyticus]|nr:sensor histidine kinase [Paenibacillus cellulosilyticus]QKS44756.1 histidine kinase [Paenibacillus cellulosilyticus]
MRKLVRYPTKLFTLMMLCFMGFSSLLLLASGIVYYETYSSIAYREIRATKTDLLDEKSQNLSNYVAGIQDTARFIVTNSMIQQVLSMPPDNAYDFVTKNRQISDEFKRLTAVKGGLYSIELYTNWLDQYDYPSPPGDFMHPMEDAASDGWLERMEASDGFWIAAHARTDGEDGLRLISYVQRIAGNRGQLLGIVKINIPEQHLFDIVSGNDAQKASDDFYIIRDSRGQYIASNLPNAELEISIREGASVQDTVGSHYSVIQSRANTEYWVLQQLITKDVLQQGAHEIRTLIVELLAGLLLVTIPLAFWLSRKLTAPIYGIVRGMRTVEKGDFNVRMQMSSIQEYSHLAMHFNRMVYRLKDLIGRLNQEHRDRREAEIQLLQSQIKPHFLYNTLDLIHWRALDHNAHEISGMVQQLSKLFRIGLSNNKWYVALRDEMLHARCYIAIQEYRQNFNIRCVEHVENDLHDVLVPKIILQPFLENAVIHGNWQRGEQAVVTVSFETHSDRIVGKHLVVTITDNGCGVPEDFDAERARGIGIRNVIDRIQLYCGKMYGVQIMRGEQGTRVVIKLPLIYHEEEMEQLRRSLSHEYDSVGG